jgi:hypothetical protein
MVGQSTHASLRFCSRGTGPAVVGACALHYESESDLGSYRSSDVAATGAWSAYQDSGDLLTA